MSLLQKITSSKLPPFANESLKLNAYIEPKSNNSFMLHTKIIPPLIGNRKPIVFIIGVDVSGSMGVLACDVNETGGNAFTVLDLIMHTLRVIIGMFNENDIFAIVKYSDNASIVLEPIYMNEIGKQQAENAIATLKTEGSTNIYDCLRLMNQIANKFQDQNVMTVLLTDGIANISQPKGDIITYKMLERKETLSTFGFGNNMNSKFLFDLAIVGGGSFAFIPDYSMVGTVFINFIASILATASSNRILNIMYSDGSSSMHDTGIIQYGQEHNLVLLLEKQPIKISINDISIEPVMTVLDEIANARFDLLNALYECIENDGKYEFTKLYSKYNTSSNDNIIAIMKDLIPSGNKEGQISMATRYWNKWGNHYVRGYYNAHNNQFCMNFKDPGLQIYGGELFHTLQDIGDKIFANLPALKPTGRIPMSRNSTNTVQSNTPVRMSNVLYNPNGGCWAPKSLVRMADNTYIPIEDIKVGMNIWTIKGSAVVEYIIVINTKDINQPMCKLNNLIITPWHPVFIDNKWEYPANITDIKEYNMPTVYNLIINKDHIIEIGGILSCTLGHMLKGDVIEHQYFGNKDLILYDLKNQPGFTENRPVFTNMKAEKDINTMKIIKWYDDI